MPIYNDALCPMPGCDGTLYITWHATRPVFLEDTVENLRDPANAYTASWEIGCENGHIVLLPVVDRDEIIFGESDEEADPELDDLKRLHALINQTEGRTRGENYLATILAQAEAHRKGTDRFPSGKAE
jgi:hypothetical protein